LWVLQAFATLEVMVVSSAFRRATLAARRWPLRQKGSHFSTRFAQVRRCTTTANDSSSLLGMLREKRHYFVHVGNVIFLMALNQTDMLQLRTLSAGASVLGLAYNLLQPVPLYAPAAWGTLFISVNLYNIAVLMRERQQITMTSDQEKIYELAFMGFGFTPRLFLDILEKTDARWITVEKGKMVHSMGDSMDEITYLQEGEVRLISNTGDEMMELVKPGRGAWLGEFFDPSMDPDVYWSKPHTHPISYRCDAEQCRLMALDRKKLHYTIKANPTLVAAATNSQVRDLWGKIRSVHGQSRLKMYESMLEIATADGEVDAKERDLCSHFRARHKITDEQHVEFLRKIGWSAVEFDGGRKTAT